MTNQLLSVTTITMFCLSLAASSSCTGQNGDPGALLLWDAEAHFFFSRPEMDADDSHRERPRRELVSLLDGATSEALVWCYGLNEPLVLDALSRARMRGVNVSITGSPDISYDEAAALGFSVYKRAKSGLAHAKVVLVDGTRMFSGTGNFTTSDLFQNNNAFFTLNVSPESGRAIKAALQAEETDGTQTLPFSGKVLVSPGDGRLIQMRIVQEILSAKNRIRFLIFSHTDPVITSALAFQAHRGIIVQGIYDDSLESGILDPDTEGGRLNDALGNLPSAVYLEGNRARTQVRPGEYHGGHVHHKTIIIDDNTVITGSYNWSMGARDQNREAYFEFRDAAVVMLFAKEFERILSHAVITPRAPFVARPNVSLRAENGNVCWDGGSPGRGFTIFSGTGADFRAEHFLPGTASSSGCMPAENRAQASAGIQWGGSYQLPMLEEDGPLPHWQFDLSAVSSLPSQGALPCNSGCAEARLKRSHMPDSWLWFAPGNEGYTGAAFWTSEGRTWRSLSLNGPSFYRFPPLDSPGGDAIVFLEHENGTRQLACIRRGSVMSGPPALWLKAFRHAGGKPPACIEDEGP